MDVLGFLNNLSDTTKFILTVMEDLKAMKNAPADVRREIEFIGMVAQQVYECLRAVVKWKTSGYDVGFDLELQLKSTVKALDVAAEYLQTAIKVMESDDAVRCVVARLQYLLRGKESIKMVVDRVEKRAGILFQRVLIQPIFHSERASSKYLPFINDAWEHSRKAKSLNWDSPVENSTVSMLDYGDAIGLGNAGSGYDGEIFVKRNRPAAKDQTERLHKMLSVKGYGSLRKEFGLLECIGYADCKWNMAHEDSHKLEGDYHMLIFKSPDRTQDPCTLRELLLRDEAKQHKLSDRLRFALTLTTSVVINHSLGIIHKFISPESIVVCSKVRAKSVAEEQFDLGTPYLLAFDEARMETGATGYDPLANNKRRNFYCHPDHHVGKRLRPFEIRDDVLSLGICLLEIGLWRSFFRDNYKDGFGKCGEQGKAFVLDDWVREIGNAALSSAAGGETKKAHSQFIANLKAIAVKELPRVMGDSYTEAVVACLDCELQPGMTRTCNMQSSTSQTSDKHDQVARDADDAGIKSKATSLRRQYLYVKTALFGPRTSSKGRRGNTTARGPAERKLGADKDKITNNSGLSIPSLHKSEDAPPDQVNADEVSADPDAAVLSSSGGKEGSPVRGYGDELRYLSRSALDSIHLVTQVLTKLESIKL